DGAVAFLRERGYARIGVMGHSYGAATSGYYAATHPETAVAVLLSCSRGGPDMLRKQSAAGRMAMDRHDEFESRARQLVAEGKGDQLMFAPGWWHVITAYSFLNQGLPKLLEYAPKIACPLLAPRGEREDPEGVPEKRTAELAGGRARSVVIPGADHFYGGQEHLVAEAVIDFLRWAER
ncbi:MAG: alpha/beta hydrolase, partial [Gemmataceae bacterium]|nr:alpha/beta hydrolase [Gemmataceae bacterium]